MLRVEGHAKGLSTLLVTIGVLALVTLGVILGIHAFLAAAGHYAPWEQIWAG
jgi:hypothetical protein